MIIDITLACHTTPAPITSVPHASTGPSLHIEGQTPRGGGILGSVEHLWPQVRVHGTASLALAFNEGGTVAFAQSSDDYYQAQRTQMTLHDARAGGGGFMRRAFIQVLQ